jgi:hypothetical protein
VKLDVSPGFVAVGRGKLASLLQHKPIIYGEDFQTHEARHV